MKFIYGDKLIDKVSDAIQVLYLADKYDVQVLVANCRDVMTKKVDGGDSIKIFETATRFGLTSLVDETRDFIAE